MTTAQEEAVARAEELARAGDADAAVSLLLRNREFERAAEVLSDAGRPAEAAELLMTALDVGIALLAGLDPDRKRMAQRAGEYFERAGEKRRAASILEALGQPLRSPNTPGTEGGSPPPDKAKGASATPRGSHVAGPDSPDPPTRPTTTPRPAPVHAPQLGPVPSAGPKPAASTLAAAPIDDDRSHRGARERERSGDLEGALALYVELGDKKDAARVAFQLGRFARAAELFGASGMPFERAVCLNKLGDGPSCLAALLDVPETHAKYRAACMQAIRLASDVGSVDPRLSRHLTAFLATPPNGDKEIAAYYECANVFAREGQHERAREILHSVVTHAPEFRDAAARLATLEATLRLELAAGERGPAAAAAEGHGAPEEVTIEELGSLAAGTVICGRYHVEAKLGEGGMAVVYRAHDHELGEPVALKLFLSKEDEGLVARFKQELSLARKLAHPNIVRLYDIGTHAGYKFITMELLEGVGLSDKLAHGRLPIAQAIGYLVQACAALSVAHEAGIVHRDIKPENFFVTRGEVLKVMDFGIAKGQRTEGAPGAGFVAGTPLYMSPEQIRSFATVTHLSDVYSLGVVAYELLTGDTPFFHEDPVKLLLMHINDPVVTPTERGAELPAELEDLVLRMLHKNPAERPQSLRDVASMLSEIRSVPPPKRNRPV